jgi:SAM-dependent methyltransferase
VGGPLKAIKALCLSPYRLRFGSETGTFPRFGGGRILDVGCGTGDYLAGMSALGWQCFGCDVSEGALAVARRRLPRATLYHGTLDDVPFEGNVFDAVTLWHSLEHLEEPLGSLKRIRDLLVTDGRLRVAVPNIDSWEAKLLGARWAGLDVPCHLFFFSDMTLSALAQKAGFEDVHARPQVHPSTVSDSLDLWVDDVRGARQSLQRRWLYYLLFPLATVSYACGNWACLELTARKGRSGGRR